jgi:hypothetical protein
VPGSGVENHRVLKATPYASGGKILGTLRSDALWAFESWEIVSILKPFSA